ncbi:MAG: hypothetical protein COB71_11450 [Thiotrichales bacterium]|nr:MAG: hypothetical protein COB71_13190 [Thiotrichales bacterium]PCI11406.1 MAG: hypothetical protein COB71_11450 [Thiotrichales bacterium]
MIPCYVSGKGMHATDATWYFKTTVIALLQSSGLGYDTRHHYYRKQFPAMAADEFARMVCDPIEYYDKDWSAWQRAHKKNFENEDALITAFFLERDRAFQAEAQLAIFGFDEAGFGSGVNVMRFIQAGKPVLGFYNPERGHEGHNIHNVMQLTMDYPEVVTLCRYRDVEEIGVRVVAWLDQQ